MISFSCSCGKKYQLPDRVAGREVRCNQCQKTLLVPSQSQEEPVTPLDDQGAETGVATETNAQKPVEPATSSTPSVSASGESTPETAWGDVPPPGSPTEPQANAAAPIPGGPSPAMYAGKPARRSSLGVFLLLLIASGISFLFGLLIGGLAGAVITGVAYSSLEFDEIEMQEQQDVDSFDEANETVDADSSSRIAEPLTAKDWIVNREPIVFSAKTGDGKPATLTKDGDPVAAAGKEDVLNVVAAALSDGNEQDKPKHVESFRIESQSTSPLRIIWPESHPVKLDARNIKAFRFSLYIPEKENASFKPGKPPGVDKTLVLGEFALRLTSETGYVEFVPADKEKLVSLVQGARKDWLPVSIPIEGDETWHRADHGLIGPLTVRQIELIVKPTGRGARFWIDNLEIAE